MLVLIFAVWLALVTVLLVFLLLLDVAWLVLVAAVARFPCFSVLLLLVLVLIVAVWLVLVTAMLVLPLLLDVAWLVLVAAVARSLCFVVLFLLVIVPLDAAWRVLEAVVALCLLEGGGVNQAEVVLVHLQGEARLPWLPGEGGKHVSPVGDRDPTWR